MRNENGQIDWTRTMEKAKEMDEDSLLHALKDIQETLPNADAMDREDGGNRGGYYRDEASVYRAELCRRSGEAFGKAMSHIRTPED